MNLKEIAALSGKSGLFRVLKPARVGYILESLDAKKIKMLAHATQRVSILKEISIYTTDKDGSAPLEQVMQALQSKYGTNPPEITKNEDLLKFLGEILPEYDRIKVYPSDVKKLLNWYKILLTFAPDVLESKT